jgi:hypothetical protein
VEREIEKLYRQLSAANREVERLEKAIGDCRRACTHVRGDYDPNYCERCDGRIYDNDPVTTGPTDQ